VSPFPFPHTLRPHVPLSSALSLIATDTFWLSQAPFKPGSWFPGAGTPRLATTSYFRLSADAGTGTGTGGGELLLLNTHLDHVSDAQRRLGAAMLLHRARHEAHAKPGILIFVTGDFNRCRRPPCIVAHVLMWVIT
jgi:hypothetical protein